MKPNPYPNSRWTNPASPEHGAPDTCESAATPVARNSCLDFSPRKWLRAPVAPNVMAGTLRNLFWGTHDANIISDARARIQRVVDQAMERSEPFNP
jgi:hypothetical protein